jgi:hypothetical protein
VRIEDVFIRYVRRYHGAPLAPRSLLARRSRSLRYPRSMVQASTAVYVR